MGKFILIDFKKREENGKLQKLVPEIAKKMDAWIRAYKYDDSTPPNDLECKSLEEAQMKVLMEEYDAAVQPLQRVKDKHGEKREALEKALDRRRGQLFSRFSKKVGKLTDFAAKVMKYCMETFEEFQTDIADLIPAKEADIDGLFDMYDANMTSYIENNFPDGVAGLDSYDDDLPEGVPSFADFKVLVQKRRDDYKKQNQDAVAPAVEHLKAKNKKRIVTEINDAIQKAVDVLVEDLSDDVLPYLDDDAMDTLRNELIATVKEYGESRLDKQEEEAAAEE